MLPIYLVVLVLITLPKSPSSNEMIAYYSEPRGTADIYVINMDGSRKVCLTDDPTNDLCPSWSPDGTRIAFTSERDGNQEIYVMDEDGANKTGIFELQN